MSTFWVTRKAIFPSILVGWNPAEPFSTTKAWILLPSLVFLAQTTTSPIVAFPIHLLVPFKSHPPSVFVAVVLRPVASLPLRGSVNPKQKIFFEFHSGHK